MMTLPCLPMIQIPVVNQQTIPMDLRRVDMESVLDLMSLTKFITYELLRLSYGNLLIYECTHCRNCGCPSFDFNTFGTPIPEEVYKHLELHAQLCDPEKYRP